MITTTVRVVAPRFVAGAVFVEGHLLRAAPILRRHLRGRRLLGAFLQLCDRRGWQYTLHWDEDPGIELSNA